ncbi:MAG: DUF411 domain-containing protein [Novosphingobium sp.]
MKRGLFLMAFSLGVVACAQASAATIAVVKDPNCGCCTEWVARLRAAGFAVTVTDTAEQPAVSRRLGVPEALRGCHSATVDGYVVEGHVPPEDIRRLLAERPKARGLAVPGMPMGSPGMEQGGRAEPYVTVLFGAGGERVFARH